MSNKIYEKALVQSPKKSAFDLSREQKLSCNMGELIPTYVEEIIPGDEFKVKSEIFCRMAPMIAPIMHRVDVYMHYFFVPNRLIWDEWEDFITGGRQGISNPTWPNFTYENLCATGDQRLMDYLGIPPDIGAVNSLPLEISQLPFRAYHLIWQEYYRDESLEPEIDINNIGIATACTLRNRAWEKDYFTSALPWAQRGSEVGVDLGPNYLTESEWYEDDGSAIAGDGARFELDASGNYSVLTKDTPGSPSTRVENLEQIELLINDLRQANAVQRWLEKAARGGYRYVETILSHFGVRSSDARLNRPEYLGGGKQPISISEVLNTSATATEPQGNMSGHGVTAGATNSFKKSFEEHGFVMGIMSVLPKSAYQQGIHRMWTRDTKYEYYWPEFANLGEQEIKMQELYVDVTAPELSETFGYQQRYAEYKYGCSTVHGDFRDSLDFWHMSRIFTSKPVLNDSFTRAVPTDRIFAVQDGTDTLWIQLYHDVKARRPMPYFSVPRL